MFKRVFVVALLLSVPAHGVMAEGDPAKGERVFKKCQACHAVGEDAKAKTGPVLNGIVGSEVAASEGYSYSPAMQEFAETGVTWTVEELDAFLAKPREHVSGTKMSFAGLRKEQERADVIAYLGTFTK
ncbi:cytochrome c family protein [Donghicola sp.]|uniref:c-type cytochrome n=1 Tax=Donghicola sp. TaxID=1929294 RepID=UPI0025D3B141|nr:cytochrome c family protein [Donghicola sp.]MCT4576508.1 cytochrome c family protein [Donghicola sp.]